MQAKVRGEFRQFAFILCVASVLCCMIVGLSACSQEPEEPTKTPDENQATLSNTRAFTDSLGRTVQLPQKVNAVVGTGPVAQEVLLTIAADKLVGLAQKPTADQEKFIGTKYSTLPLLGQIYGGKGDFNKEAVANAKPQVVIDIGDSKKGIEDDLNTLQDQLGIPCVHLEGTLSNYDKMYTQLGELLGDADRAKTLADYCAKALNDTKQKMATIPADERIKALYCMGESGLQVIPKGSIQASVFDLIVDNQAILDNATSAGKGSQVSLEQLANWNPDLIIFGPQSVFDQVGKDQSWLSLNAISSGNYYQVPGSPYNWLSSPPSVNQILGLQWFARICYPQHYDDNLFDVVANYYKTFYNYNMTQDDYDKVIKGAIPIG